ncbi:MAG: sodium:solute symporter family protein [Spongiibacteraceae bacterium]|nr:sodium:solute symporter family protein [Spongiibacteraceae bacterium]
MATPEVLTTAIIIAYLVFFACIGIYLNKNNRTSADWATGGGNFGIWMLAAGIAGTRIGGAGTYGVAGDVMASGIGNLWYSINTFAALILVGFFFAVPYRRLNLSSVGEVFKHRFSSKRCQSLTSLCVQAEYLVVNIIEPYVIGSIVSGVTGLPFVAGVFIGGFVIILFTVTGGLKGTAITNIIHCGVIIVGLTLVGYVAMMDSGGWSEVVRNTDQMLINSNKDPASWWSFSGIGWATVIALFISATIHTPAASVYANYASSASKQSYLLPGFILAGCIAALMPLIAGFIGIQTLARYGAESGLSGYLNIAQLAIDTGPILGGIALAAVLAAVISSGAPILLASATMFVNDWIPGSAHYSTEKKLRVYKIATVLYGLLATCIAWLSNIGSVLHFLLLGYAMVVPPAIAIFFVFYWKRTTEKAAFWGILSGFVSGLLVWLFNTLFQGAENAAVGGLAQFWYEWCQTLGQWGDPSFFTLLMPLFVIPVIVILSETSTREEIEQCEGFFEKLGRR